MVRVVRYRVLISGLVQGVSFRDACRRTAERHGVSGWVRNLPDGSVEAVFEGSATRSTPWWHGRATARGLPSSRTSLQAEPPEGTAGFQIR